MSKSIGVKFNVHDQPEFYQELRRRVNQYFEDRNLSKHANLNMKIKTVFMVLLYFTPLVLMVTGVVTSLWPVMFLWVLMGFGMSGIGLSIMHDANHGAYSADKNVNKAVGYILNFIGGYPPNWKIQHNVLHHSYTNVHHHDEDIEKTILRLTPDTERKPFHRVQVFYAPFLYGLMSIYWLVSKDFEQLVRYKKNNLLAGQGLTFRRALAEVLFNKTWYILLILVLPLLTTQLAWWQVLIGFLIMHAITGLILALIFQPAHVVEETQFYSVDETGSVENNWAIHQLKTTTNFANGSRMFSWFVGGLNYQIEHHLFPQICHVHYRHLSPIVKATAEEFNVPYYHHPTFFDAVRSHFTLLNKLGTGKYDENLAAATA
ncbi:MAG: acyl-CoA desaturase [Bacteroidetes bacterium]|nr:MAG: acyl-CoA desaturase [Bacteroidota bacterium]PTM14027.1 MAG: acyl-CoA desaturase [Bacteroidota bacterium]